MAVGTKDSQIFARINVLLTPFRDWLEMMDVNKPTPVLTIFGFKVDTACNTRDSVNCNGQTSQSRASLIRSDV
jgi:hypothetical protein